MFDHEKTGPKLLNQPIGRIRLAGEFAWRSIIDGCFIVPDGPDIPTTRVDAIFAIAPGLDLLDATAVIELFLQPHLYGFACTSIWPSLTSRGCQEIYGTLFTPDFPLD